MKFYRISRQSSDDTGEHKGYEFTTSKKGAKTYLRKNPWLDESEVEPIEVQPTKRGILRALNVYAGHPDNG